MKFCDFLKERREEKGLSRNDLASLLKNTSPETIKAWEYGLNYPSGNSLAELSKALHVRFDYLRSLLINEKYPYQDKSTEGIINLHLLNTICSRSDIEPVREIILNRLSLRREEVKNGCPQVWFPFDLDCIQKIFHFQFECYSKELPFFYVQTGLSCLDDFLRLAFATCGNQYEFTHEVFLLATDYQYFASLENLFNVDCNDFEGVKQLWNKLNDDYWSYYRPGYSTRTFDLTMFLRMWLSEIDKAACEQAIIENKYSFYSESKDFRKELLNDTYVLTFFPRWIDNINKKKE